MIILNGKFSSSSNLFRIKANFVPEYMKDKDGNRPHTTTERMTGMKNRDKSISLFYK